jgi:hypothetical protein
VTEVDVMVEDGNTRTRDAELKQDSTSNQQWRRRRPAARSFGAGVGMSWRCRHTWGG